MNTFRPSHFEGRNKAIECKIIARANPHWKLLGTKKRTTAIFHGPHHYISPSWYEKNEGNVPTWNYASVFVNGFAEEEQDSKVILEHLDSMVMHKESSNDTDWKLNKDSKLALAPVTQ